MDSLPIDEVLDSIVGSLRKTPSLVLRAPPGAGKTTRVPSALIARGLVPRDQRVLMLEPRRVAARAAAKRIAFEEGTRLGDRVGYQIRFEDVSSKATRLLILTEGLLTRKLEADPTLEGVGAVVLDEFHERSIHADLALLFLREIQAEVRPDLKIVVMSATLEAGPIAEYLDGAPVIESAGKLHPVEVRFDEGPDREDDRRLPEQVLSAIRRAIKPEEGDDGGDLLVFLPGAPEIRRAEALIQPALSERFEVRTLYGELDSEAQDRALAPRAAGGRRKIVLATNIAETSLTIEGVTTVIDSGLAKILRHDPARGFDRLDTVRISRASADQRTGRAGRTAPGRAFRMWSRAEDRRLIAREVPEVMRVDLAPTVLELLAWSARDPKEAGLLDAPPPAMFDRAIGLLRDLGAVEAEGFKLTERGRQIRAFPLHPRLASIAIEADRRGVLEGGALLAALASERDVIRRPRRDADRPAVSFTESLSGPSDLLLRAELVEGRRSAEIDGDAARAVLRVRDRLVEIAKRTLRGPSGARKVAGDREEALLHALLSGFPDRVARRREAHSDRVVLATGRGAKMAKESVVREPRLLLAIEVDDTKRPGESGAESLVRIASAIEEPWLVETGRVIESREVRWNAARQAVEAVIARRYHAIPLSERADPEGDPEAIASLLAEQAGRDLEKALPRSEDFDELAARVAFLRRTMPELELVALDAEGLRALLPRLCYGRRSFAELAKIDLVETLKAELGHRVVAAIDRHAPERIDVPSGSKIKLRYEPDGPPALAVRLQEVFGMIESPKVAGGRVAVKMELLAPNQRPVQVTQDLRSFWAGAYVEVRKELRARYPRHSWPDDPLSAAPERRPKRRR